MTHTDPAHPALVALASLLSAIRSGVLVLAPGLPDDQVETLNSEIAGYDYCINAAFANDPPTILPAFATAPAPAAGNYQKSLIALAGVLTHGARAMKIFDEYSNSCPPELVFARWHAKQAHESAGEMVEAFGPRAQADIVAMVQQIEAAITAAAVQPTAALEQEASAKN